MKSTKRSTNPGRLSLSVQYAVKAAWLPTRAEVRKWVRAADPGSGPAYRVVADVNLRQGPGNDFPRIGALARGTTVAVTAERLGWLQIRLADGGSGWVYKRWLEATGAP